MNLVLPIVLVAILANSFAVGGNNDDDKKPIPASHAYSGCRLKNGGVTGHKSASNPYIQQGECWCNTRILNQRSAFFVPLDPSDPNYDAEGGPYGLCTGLDGFPKEAEMEESKNLAEFCFFWQENPNNGSSAGKGGGGCGSVHMNENSRKGKNSTGDVVPKAPGKPTIPMPIVCPSSLKDCYSADWYEPGGKLAAYGCLVPTYEGPWFPLKDPAKGTPLFCQGLNLGCETPTMHELQLHQLPKKNCDVKKCKDPKGSTKTGNESTEKKKT